jgi:hypothetical protein
MFFNTYTFWIFFAMILPLYWFLVKKDRQNKMLFPASYIFYVCWNVRFLPVLLCSPPSQTTGSLARRSRFFSSVKATASGSFLSALTCSFSEVLTYYDSFAHQLLTAAAQLGLQLSLPLLQAILPVGIRSAHSTIRSHYLQRAACVRTCITELDEGEERIEEWIIRPSVGSISFPMCRQSFA